MTNRRSLLAIAGAAAMALGGAGAAWAAEYEFTLQSFLPAQATIPAMIIDVWADKVEEASGGRIEITRYAAMQLGGKPPELYDQVIDGMLDITWNVNGYTPGRFPRSEVFELPFMVTDAAAASAAYWTMMDNGLKDEEFQDMKVLGVWVHGPGVIHSNVPVDEISDMNGMKIRGPSRLANVLLKELGATPVGMPIPSVPEALSKGVIDGAMVPWEVTRALKTSELVHNHTEFTGAWPYTVTFVLAMNRDKFDALPEDLQKVIMDNSAMGFSVFAGTTQAGEDTPGRDAAIALGNNVITISEEETAKWVEAAQPVYAEWIAEMKEKGIDGQALIDEARALMAEYAK